MILGPFKGINLVPQSSISWSMLRNGSCDATRNPWYIFSLILPMEYPSPYCSPHSECFTYEGNQVYECGRRRSTNKEQGVYIKKRTLRRWLFIRFIRSHAWDSIERNSVGKFEKLSCSFTCLFLSAIADLLSAILRFIPFFLIHPLPCLAPTLLVRKTLRVEKIIDPNKYWSQPGNFLIYFYYWWWIDTYQVDLEDKVSTC